MKPESIPQEISLDDLHVSLRSEGCASCSLGVQPGLIGPILSKGNSHSKVIFLGEAPGKDEDTAGIPFVGKAGKLLDEWLTSFELMESGIYISNCVKCRPIAVPESGKQNNTPQAEHLRSCKPYLLYEISVLKPRLIVTLGLSATKACLTGDIPKIESLKQVMGKFHLTTNKNRCRIPSGILFFPTYHPAAFLHARNEQVNLEMKENLNQHFTQIKEAIDELQDM